MSSLDMVAWKSLFAFSEIRVSIMQAHTYADVLESMGCVVDSVSILLLSCALVWWL